MSGGGSLPPAPSTPEKSTDSAGKYADARNDEYRWMLDYYMIVWFIDSSINGIEYTGTSLSWDGT